MTLERSRDMLFLKFGKKEHLQQLKDGIVHFRPLSSFAGDPTHFRGDRLEGKLLIDLSHPILINNFDIAPYTREAVQTYDGFDSILSFSVSILNYTNCHATKDGLFAPNDDFIEEMKQFGSHMLIFSARDLILGLAETLRMHKCNFEYHPIFYCDKTDHAAITKYFRDKGNAENPYEYCFIKDYTPYAKQNEWRIIIHDIGNEFRIGDSGGVNIKTEFRTEMPIFETTALTTLLASEEYLK